jgi:hypothetical protein
MIFYFGFYEVKILDRLTTHLPLVMTCLRNNYVLCKISHMQIISTSGEELAINIVMIARQYAFCICWASFVQVDMYCCKIEWLFYEP